MRRLLVILRQYQWYGFLFLMFAIHAYITPLLSMDEIWNYGFAKKVAEGFVPYRDFNLVIPPLFPLLGAIFASDLSRFRLFGSVINAAISGSVYYSSQKHSQSQSLGTILTIGACAALSVISFASYNTLLIFSLFLCYLAVVNNESKPSMQRMFRVGFVLAISLLIKHPAPAVLIVVITAVYLLRVFRGSIRTRELFAYALGGILPVAALVIYLNYHNALKNFLDYIFWGLPSFTENFTISNPIGTLSVLVMSVMITIRISTERVKKLKDQRLGTAVLFSLISYILLIPIVDLYHAIQLLVFQLLMLADSISLEKNTIPDHPPSSKARLSFAAGLVAVVMFLIPGVQTNGMIRSEIEDYKGILISPDIEQDVLLISEFIRSNEKSGNDVAVVHKSAYLYTLPANDTNGVLDLMLTGNIGTLAHEEIKMILSEKDLILTNTHVGNQDIREIREYILENYCERGSIGNMQIFQPPADNSAVR